MVHVGLLMALAGLIRCLSARRERHFQIGYGLMMGGLVVTWIGGILQQNQY